MASKSDGSAHRHSPLDLLPPGRRGRGGRRGGGDGQRALARGQTGAPRHKEGLPPGRGRAGCGGVGGGRRRGRGGRGRIGSGSRGGEDPALDLLLQPVESFDLLRETSTSLLLVQDLPTLLRLLDSRGSPCAAFRKRTCVRI